MSAMAGTLKTSGDPLVSNDSQILKTAVRARYLPANSAEGVDLPRKPRREQLCLNPSEVDRLASVIEDQLSGPAPHRLPSSDPNL